MSANIRDRYGRIVRETWVRWAQTQPDIDQHPNWLVGWDDLPERDREVDRQIGFEIIAHWQLDSFKAAATPLQAAALAALVAWRKADLKYGHADDNHSWREPRYVIAARERIRARADALIANVS